MTVRIKETRALYARKKRLLDRIELLKKEIRQINITELTAISKAVFDVTDITLDELRSKSRKAEIVEAKRIFVFHARKWYTQTEIAEFLDMLHHTSIMHLARTYKLKYSKDLGFKLLADAATKRIKEII